jgi:hypothetical protein
MIKILYAASNNLSSKIQLERFIKNCQSLPFIIKIAAFKKSSPRINIDWTLDSLLDIYNPNNLNLNNDNLQIYYDQIKLFNPDLIISDLEFFTSYIANLLNKPLWQCNSSIINFALDKKDKYNLGIFKKYSFLLNKNPQHTQRIINILDNSSFRFIYSHFGDVENSLKIDSNYEWIRPYHSIGKKSPTCHHNIILALDTLDKRLLSDLKNQNDIVLFCNNFNENYNDIKIKNLNNESEYYCNLYNSNFFICNSQINFLSDSFYNQKKAFTITNFFDIDSIINSTISSKLNLSKDLTDLNNIEIFDEKNFDISYKLNENIKYLHEKIIEYYN